MESFVDYFSAYWHTWLVEALVVMALMAVLVLSWKRISRAVMSHMILSALLIWIAGTVLYGIGFAYEGSGRTLTSYLLRAMQASLGMFISDNELMEVSHHYKESPLYMALFAVAHASALFLSAIIILNTIGFRLKHFFLLLQESAGKRNKDKDTYVFWGYNEPSMCLAKDIRKSNPEARIIFVRSTGETSIGERLEVTELMNASAGAARSIKMTRAIGTIDDAIVAYMPAENVENARIGRLRKIFDMTTNISFFFLSQDEALNVKLASLVYADKSLSENPDKNVRIYTKVTNGGKNRVLENHIVLEQQRGNRAVWKFIDPSYLSVTSLKRRFDLQPVMSLPSGGIHEGAVDSQFTALVLGFGNTGQAMFNYLYEFSSFVKSSGERAARKMVIVDKDIDRRAGQFCINNPSVFHTDEVQMLGYEPGTVEFWRSVRQYASSVNCITVALGSDEADVNITMDLYRAILQHRERRPENVKIFLHIYSSENEESINRLADSYNSHKEDTGIELVPFGSISEVFSTGVIIGTDQLKAARRFNYNFDLMRGVNTDCDEDQAWARDYDVKSYIEKYKAVPLAIEELSRQIIQCNSDALHIGTILALAGVDVDDKKSLSSYVEVVRSREPGSMVYSAATPQMQKLMDNLARSAHARLYSSHWLLGYRYADLDTIIANPVDASRRKLTSYMKEWDECTGEEKLLAYIAVDTSFIIAMNL